MASFDIFASRNEDFYRRGINLLLENFWKVIDHLVTILMVDIIEYL